MRSIVRFALATLFASLASFSAGCEEAATGGRCESVNDCDRTGGGTTRSCYSTANTNLLCAGSGNSCVCCPRPEARVPGTTPAICLNSTTVIDSGVTQDSGSNQDSGSDVAQDSGSPDVTSAPDAAGQDASAG